MAKTALVNRDKKRRETVKKYAAKRKELLEIINNQRLSQEDRYAARLKMQQLPRNASPVRLRNRCALTGPSARRVQEVRAGAQQAARHRDARARSRRDQGELVAGQETAADDHERSDRRHADAHPQCAAFGESSRWRCPRAG